LAIGFGVSALALGDGSHTFDHDAPLTETNWHLLGLMLQHFKTAQFELLVGIDLWRCFLPEDLSLLVTKGLHKADRLHLVATDCELDPVSMLPLPFIADVDDAARMLSAHFKVEVTRADASTVLTIR
jgi:hypothetical protein